MKRYRAVLALAFVLAGCTTVGNLGMITRSRSDMAGFLKSGHEFQDLGPAQGKTCRHFILGAVPWGNADVQQATDFALQKSTGDALINVTTVNSLYSFVPLYNIYSISCTTVKGTAIKFQ